MTNFEIGLYALGSLFVLLALRFPIAIALSIVSFAGILAIRGPRAAYGQLGVLPFDFAASWTLSAVPMFLLMGAFAFNSGMTISVYKVFRMWFWWLPGGLAIATNWASAAFGAISGSSIAVTAVMARIAIPEMLRYRYDKSLATSVVAASGHHRRPDPAQHHLHHLRVQSETSITEALFLAGVVPGILTGVVYTVLIMARCLVNPTLAPRASATSPRRSAAPRRSTPGRCRCCSSASSSASIAAS